jgi:hypothetical protein
MRQIASSCTGIGGIKSQIQSERISVFKYVSIKFWSTSPVVLLELFFVVTDLFMDDSDSAVVETDFEVGMKYSVTVVSDSEVVVVGESSSSQLTNSFKGFSKVFSTKGQI